jgi:hypothetical protein
MKALSFRGASLLMLLAFLVMPFAPTPRAAALSSDVISMFPSTIGEFAYADLRQARQFPWFAQLKEQMLPAKFRQFEQFLTAAGMDPDTQVQEVAWGLVATGVSSGAAATGVPTGEQIVGVALGDFQPAAVKTYFANKKSAAIQVRGYTLYAFSGAAGTGDLFFMFLDANTAAFGQRSLLEKVIDVRLGQQQNVMSNATLYPLINQSNGHGMVWAVLNPSYARLALQQLLPQAAQFPQAAQLLANIQSLVIRIQNSSGIQADFQANCANANDATTMGSVLQAGLMLGRYQATSKNNATLGQLLDTARINPNGNQLTVSLSLTNDQVVALIQSKTFALQM